jgi:hypothetical protein
MRKRLHRRARKGRREKKREIQFTTEGTESTERQDHREFGERRSISSTWKNDFTADHAKDAEKNRRFTTENKEKKREKHQEHIE